MAAALLLVACGDGGNDSAATTASTASGLQLDQPVLVTGIDGVFQIGTDGTITGLLDGPVSVAVDDARGGLLYQLESGRSREPDDRSTIVWWIPKGAGGAQELLVPGPSSGHLLTLHDTYATPSGFAVLYTRHETDHSVDEMVDSLRRFDVADRQVTELYSQGAIGQGFGDISAGGALISGTWYGEVGSECFLLDLDGRQRDLVPPAAGDPAADEYVGGCRLSPDGTRLAFVTTHPERVTVSLRNLETGEQTEFEILEGDGRVGSIDLSDRALLVNLERYGPLPAIVFDLDTPDVSPRQLPITGVARFTSQPLDIGRQPASPTTSSAPTSSTTTSTRPPASPSTSAHSTVPSPPTGELVLRSDGLGVVAFGEPLETALPALTKAVGSQPTADSTTTGVMPQGFGGSTVRFVSFGQLTVIFSDGGYYRDDGVMYFAGWSLGGPGQASWATPQGITIGSTVDDLRTAYGDQLRLPPAPDECAGGAWTFSVGPTALGFEGELSGPPTDTLSTVTRLAAGAQSSC